MQTINLLADISTALLDYLLLLNHLLEIFLSCYYHSSSICPLLLFYLHLSRTVSYTVLPDDWFPRSKMLISTQIRSKTNYDDDYILLLTLSDDLIQEWLRSLPDCLLMSRLYPQWIDVAKLIEPLHQQQQQRQHHLSHLQSQSLDDSFKDNTISSNASLRPTRSPLTDNGQLLDRAYSCSTMMLDISINSSENNLNEFGSIDSECSPASSNRLATRTISDGCTMSTFALNERHSECLRIVRQLLDALNEPNLILLRSFICVLRHIADNSEHNKMSANNLGVCVGQSLLNDKHQSDGKATASTFTKRHRRTRSQCFLSSTLSLTGSSTTISNSVLPQNGCYLSSNSAQVS